VNRPGPRTSLHFLDLPAHHLPDRLRVPAVRDAAAPLMVWTCVPGAAVAFPSRAGRAS
jgi:hypothetical protein